jgi:hypothetical protein
MRDQYVGDVSDVLKVALLRVLAGTDKRLGIAWYYAPGNDGRPDGRHLEWRKESTWHLLDKDVCAALSSLPVRSVSALEQAAIWPTNILFHREPMPPQNERHAWATRKRAALERADLIFLDPDNGLGRATEKHATFSEVQLLRRTGRALVFITFPGRNMPHDSIVKELHHRLEIETGTEHCITLRISVMVPRAGGWPLHVPRQRWFTIVDPDASLAARVRRFATALGSVPRVRVRLDGEV